MPPHCDSLDGPVVNAAREALRQGNVALVLPFVKADAEAELTHAFELASKAAAAGGPGAEAGERHLFETAVRLHRAGEGAPFTGLKPAGLDVGPVIPLAEHACASGDGHELEARLVEELREQLAHRLGRVRELAGHASHGLPAARAHVEAMLGLQVWAHGVHLAISATPHGEGHAEGHAAPEGALAGGHAH